MEAASAEIGSEGGADLQQDPSFPSWSRPYSRIQRVGLIAFLFVSIVDIALSAFLFFGGDGGYVEANPVLAWATGGFAIFLVAVVAVKAIGLGLVALLVAIANRVGTLAGDAVIFAALCTTTALFLLELVTVGAVPTLLAAGELLLHR